MLSIFLLFVEKTQKREIPEFGTFFVLNLHLFLNIRSSGSMARGQKREDTTPLNDATLDKV